MNKSYVVLLLQIYFFPPSIALFIFSEIIQKNARRKKGKKNYFWDKTFVKEPFLCSAFLIEKIS